MKSIIFGIALTAVAAAKKLDLVNLDATLANETLFSKLYNTTMEWGTYKPDLFFGVKNRQNHPLSAGMFWYTPVNNTVETRYAYVEDKGVVGHYEFHDASSSSKQILKDSLRNTNFIVEFQKEIEENQTPDEYISRWTAKITVQAQDPTQKITGNPVLFFAKEGKQPNEDGFFQVTSHSNKRYKLQHSLSDNVYESLEILDSSQNISLLGVEVEESMSWQLDKIWTSNYDQFVDQSGILNTTKPNVIMIRPLSLQDG